MIMAMFALGMSGLEARKEARLKCSEHRSGHGGKGRGRGTRGAFGGVLNKRHPILS